MGRLCAGGELRSTPATPSAKRGAASVDAVRRRIDTGGFAQSALQRIRAMPRDDEDDLYNEEFDFVDDDDEEGDEGVDRGEVDEEPDVVERAVDDRDLDED